MKIGHRVYGMLVGISLTIGAGLASATPLQTATGNGLAWLAQQRNGSDGSWGNTDPAKYINTSEAVLALAALNQQNAAYFGGVAWLSNHAPVNVDFTARRILALVTSNSATTADVQFLQSVQNTAAPGNNGWGLASAYQGSPLDTALALQALNQTGASTGVSAAVSYLLLVQLPVGDAGWSIGAETVSDPITTAQVLLALAPVQSQYGAVPVALSTGLASLNAKVTASSPSAQLALATLANLRIAPTAVQTATLLNALLSQQGSDGSWGDDPFATALALRAIAAAAGKDLAAQKQVIAVPDNALRAAINATLGHGALDALTLGDMQQLTSLNASGLGITNLSGLQYATNLASLDVSNNKIASFSPLVSFLTFVI